jgi:hypothetical protein
MVRVSATAPAVSGRIAPESPDPQVQALIKLEVACHLALEALPGLPDETEQALREPVQRLCDVTGTELDRIDPGWRSRLPDRLVES